MAQHRHCLRKCFARGKYLNTEWPSHSSEVMRAEPKLGLWLVPEWQRCERKCENTESDRLITLFSYVAKYSLRSVSSWLLTVQTVCVCESVSCSDLVSLVVEAYPCDSGVSWASEADNLLGMTPLKHPDTTILSSSQV